MPINTSGQTSEQQSRLKKPQTKLKVEH